MTKTLKLLAISAAFVATQASAVVIGDFRLNGSTVNSAGGPLTLTNNGASFSTVSGANGLTFVANAGPTVSGFSSPSDFSIETQFQFDSTGGYTKIADFLNRGSDTGLYNLSGSLVFYDIAGGPGGAFAPGQFVSVVLTRDAGGTTAGYVNGVQQFSFVSAGLTAVTSDIHFFRDDFATGQAEATSGFVDYIRVYDTALTASEVAGLTPPGGGGLVPEPAAWALLIGGFGLVGAASRRRRGNLVTA